MARFNLVKIGTEWLTSDGTEAGSPCKTNVIGLRNLVSDKTGSVKIASDGTPHVQLLDTDKKGNLIEIQTSFMEKAVFDDIIAIHNAAKNGSLLIALEILGDTGDFIMDSVPAVPNDIEFEGFSGGIIKSATFRYITA